MTSILSRKFHQVNVFEEAAPLWRKASSHENVLSHVNREWHDKAHTKLLWWTGEKDETPRLSLTEKVYITVTGKNR